jgi:hypothetical protein
VFGHGGVPSVNQGFHPGFLSQGNYSGIGGGRFGGRGRLGGWLAQHRGGLGGSRGSSMGNTGGPSMGSGSSEALEHRVNQNAADANFALSSSRGRPGQVLDKEA